MAIDKDELVMAMNSSSWNSFGVSTTCFPPQVTS